MRKKDKETMLQLLEQKRYHDLYFFMRGMNPIDIAEEFKELEPAERIIAYRLLNKDDAVDVFSELDSDAQEDLINAFTDKELYEVTSNMLADDTVDMLEEMPSNIVKRILKHTDAQKRRVINQLLQYPDDSAGSVMTVEFIDLRANMTVEQAFARIRKIGVSKETIYTCYVLNESRMLEGIVTLKELLLSSYETKISDIMETNLITVHTYEDQETAARTLEKYDLLALPVVDRENRLVGIVTIDDAIDVIQDENTEDFERMNALAPAEDTYFKTTVWEHSKNRIIWLLVLMLSAAITGSILTNYEDAISSIPLLVSFIPMLMNTGGNCGSQSSTLIIRGMAVDEIEPKDFWRALWKEARIAIIVSVILCVVNAIRIIIQYRDPGIAVVVSLTLAVTIVISKMLGCTLPMLAKRLKLDPAIMAAPLITTIVDTCSVLVYFNVALRILHFA